MSAWRERVEIAGGRAVLYLGDNREIWPALGVRPDALISDPPYGIAERTDRRASGRGNLAEANDFPPVFGDDQPFDPAEWLQAASRIVLWGANHYCSRVPDGPSWLVWDKRDGIPSNNNADCEIAWSNLGGPARVYRHLWYGMIRASEKQDVREHPTQKPVALMAWCLEQAKVETAALVADPFMGSGTTGVACMRRGCRFIGIEIDEGYFRTACRRIGEAARQPDLLIPETTT